MASFEVIELTHCQYQMHSQPVNHRSIHLPKVDSVLLATAVNVDASFPLYDCLVWKPLPFKRPDGR
jgi:hypothetical protein